MTTNIQFQNTPISLETSEGRTSLLYHDRAVGTLADRGDGQADFIPAEELSMLLMPATTDDIDALARSLAFEIAQKRRAVHRALDMPEPHRPVGMRVNLYLSEPDDGFSDIYAGDERIGVVRHSDQDGHNFVPAKYYDGILTEVRGDTIADLIEGLEFTLTAGRTLIEETYHFTIELKNEGADPPAIFPTASAFTRAATNPLSTYLPGDLLHSVDRKGITLASAERRPSDLEWPDVEPGTPCEVFLIDITGDIFAVASPWTQRSPCALLGSLPRASMMKSESQSFPALCRKLLGDIAPDAPLSALVLALRKAQT